MPVLIRHEAQPMHAQYAEVRTAKITLVFKIKDLRMLGCRAPLARTAQAELRDESGFRLIGGLGITFATFGQDI